MRHLLGIQMHSVAADENAVKLTEIPLLKEARRRLVTVQSYCSNSICSKRGGWERRVMSAAS